MSQPSPPPSVRPAMPVEETTPPRGGEAVELCLAVEPVPGDAALRAGGACPRIDMDALHQGQVEHQAALGRRAPRDIVAAAADGDLQPLVARQLHRIDDVGQAAAAGDECRALVDEAVMHLPGVLVARIARPQDLSHE
nr:hypothetical protein [Siccirubricoccus sp. G192]